MEKSFNCGVYRCLSIKKTGRGKEGRTSCYTQMYTHTHTHTFKCDTNVSNGAGFCRKQKILYEKHFHKHNDTTNIHTYRHTYMHACVHIVSCSAVYHSKEIQ